MKSKRQSGFTLMELMVALVVFLAVSSIVMSGMTQMMRTQAMVGNRTEMHTSVRSATELLQQEIGQAGKISLPAAVTPVTLTGPIVVVAGAVPVAQTAVVSSTTNMFPNMLLDIDAGQNFEVVTVTAVTANSITAIFTKSHGTGAVPIVPVKVSGSFGTGIVPPGAGLACATAGYTPYPGPGTGSTCTTLKLYGDINGDGNIIYVEYSCDTTTNPGFLYRNEVANAIVVGTVKPAVNASMYLLNNVEPNPNGNGCFTYQVQNASVNGVVTPFVTDVAVTLTVQTQMKDLRTNQYQQETKALLNITPRNVFYVWEATSLGEVPRNQPMPANISSML
jgi:prepilin-type N-terminal cleavage/methylation domain-containing protein